MDLAFYTLRPRHNKMLVINLITRIVEGKSARYVTGSGQTRKTADRVEIFRVVGNCEAIPRPPRQRKSNINSNSNSNSNHNSSSWSAHDSSHSSTFGDRPDNRDRDRDSSSLSDQNIISLHDHSQPHSQSQPQPTDSFFQSKRPRTISSLTFEQILAPMDHGEHPAKDTPQPSSQPLLRAAATLYGSGSAIPSSSGVFGAGGEYLPFQMRSFPITVRPPAPQPQPQQLQQQQQQQQQRQFSSPYSRFNGIYMAVPRPPQVLIPAPCDVSGYLQSINRLPSAASSAGSPLGQTTSILAPPADPLPVPQVEWITTQQQFIAHMPPFLSRVTIPDPVHIFNPSDICY